MFYFAVHRIELAPETASDVYGDPEHVMTLKNSDVDGEPIRVERCYSDTNEFYISANLGNANNEMGIRYSVNVWCGDTEVLVVNMKNAVVRAGAWLGLGTINLDECLNDMLSDCQDAAYLRVSLNIVLNALNDPTRTSVTHSGDQVAAPSASNGNAQLCINREVSRRRLELCDIVAWQYFIFLGAKAVEALTGIKGI